MSGMPNLKTFSCRNMRPPCTVAKFDDIPFIFGFDKKSSKRYG